MTDATDPLRELDQRLGAVRFNPRDTFAEELAGRVRRGEAPRGAGPRGHRRILLAGALAAGMVALALGVSRLLSARHIEVDRCCFDLDGGGVADDGVRIEARRNADVHHLWIYEDTDHSGTLTAADSVRLERGRKLALAPAGTAGLVTLERCCLDFDGGGAADDGLLVIGVPPNRVVMAAIYERGPTGADGPVRTSLR